MIWLFHQLKQEQKLLMWQYKCTSEFRFCSAGDLPLYWVAYWGSSILCTDRKSFDKLMTTVSSVQRWTMEDESNPHAGHSNRPGPSATGHFTQNVWCCGYFLPAAVRMGKQTSSVSNGLLLPDVTIVHRLCNINIYWVTISHCAISLFSWPLISFSCAISTYLISCIIKKAHMWQWFLVLYYSYFPLVHI